MKNKQPQSVWSAEIAHNVQNANLKTITRADKAKELPKQNQCSLLSNPAPKLALFVPADLALD